MTRDLPLGDDESGPAENADTAYRVATGVSRVARAGAYVTGGALVAANGTSGLSNDDAHDSRNVGWAQPNDPEPDAPSPVVTFPELDFYSVPPVLGGGPEASPIAEQFGNDVGLFPAEFGAAGMSTMPGYDQSAGNPASGWDPSAGLQRPNGYDPSAGLGNPGYDPSAGVGAPGAYDPSAGLGPQPGPFDPSAGLGQQPDGVFDPSAGLNQPGGFNPGAGLGFDDSPADWGQQFGQFLKMPGADGLQLPGMNGMGLAQAQATPGSPLDPNVFDGVGEDGFGLFVSTDSGLSVHVGLDGVWVDSHVNVEVGIGDVGDQLDRFNQSAKDALADPSKIQGSGAVDQSATGGMSGLRATGGPGSANSPAVVPTSAPAAAAPAAPAAAPIAPVAPAVAPAATPFAPAPVAPAAVAPAPVVPVPVAPAPVAPVAVAQPVVATPLQTTIQPDVATTPMANVWAAPAGQSPLTAPAVATPALFDRPAETVPTQQPSETVIARPTPVTGTTGTQPTVPPVSTPDKTDTGAGLTTAPAIPTKIPGVTDPATTKLPGATDPATTKLPGATDPATTKVPGATTAPTTPDVDIPATTPDLPASTVAPVPTADDPDIGTTPTVPDDIDTGSTPVPTVSKPALPTASIPDNYSTPDLGTPDVTVPDATVPTMAPTQPNIEPMPTMTQPAPIKPAPPTNPATPAKPIADSSDSGAAHPALFVHDSAYTHDGADYDGGTLSTHLMSEATFAETHYPVHGPFDLTLL